MSKRLPPEKRISRKSVVGEVNKTMKKELYDKLNKIIELLDCKIDWVFERRDLISGQLDCYNKPYEIIIGFPVSMGERGVMESIYYDQWPTPEDFYKDVRKELNYYLKNIESGAYEEQRAKIIRKALRNKVES